MFPLHFATSLAQLHPDLAVQTPAQPTLVSWTGCRNSSRRSATVPGKRTTIWRSPWKRWDSNMAAVSSPQGKTASVKVSDGITSSVSIENLKVCENNSNIGFFFILKSTLHVWFSSGIKKLKGRKELILVGCDKFLEHSRNLWSLKLKCPAINRVHGFPFFNQINFNVSVKKMDTNETNKYLSKASKAKTLFVNTLTQQRKFMCIFCDSICNIVDKELRLAEKFSSCEPIYNNLLKQMTHVDKLPENVLDDIKVAGHVSSTDVVFKSVVNPQNPNNCYPSSNAVPTSEPQYDSISQTSSLGSSTSLSTNASTESPSGTSSSYADSGSNYRNISFDIFHIKVSGTDNVGFAKTLVWFL